MIPFSSLCTTVAARWRFCRWHPLPFWYLLVLLVCATLGGCGGGDGSPSSPLLRVACVGDSITAGVGSPQAYPVILGGLLGHRYNVGNFGSSGTTIVGGGAGAYVKKPAFSEALAFHPDIVVIELGTNDSLANFTPAVKTAFLRGYKELIASFANGTSKPRIFACLPPASYPASGARNQSNRQIVTPLIEQAARETGARVIDLNTPLSNQPALFPDGLHPNFTGAKKLSLEVEHFIEMAPSG